MPMKMEPIVSSETSAIRTQTPGNYPKRNNLQSGLSLRVGGVLPEDLEATTCSVNNQAQHHMPHGVSQWTKSLRPGDYSLMILSFVTSSVAQKLKKPEQANRTDHLPLKHWMYFF